MRCVSFRTDDLVGGRVGVGEAHEGGALDEDDIRHAVPGVAIASQFLAARCGIEGSQLGPEAATQAGASRALWRS